MKLLAILTAASLAVPMAASAASVTIDNFANTNFQFVGAPTLGGTAFNPATTSGPTTDAIGGFRTITATRTSPAGTDNAFGQQVQALVTMQVASVTLGVDTEGFAEFFYGIAGDLNADLTGGGMNDQLVVNVLGADLAGVTYTLKVDGISVTQTATGAGLLEYSFANFAGTDFADVDAISLLVAGPASFDTTFNLIEARQSTVSEVPLPASVPLLLAGLGMFGIVTRRRSS